MLVIVLKYWIWNVQFSKVLDRILKLTSEQIDVQSEQCKYKKMVWNMFKMNNKGARHVLVVSLLLTLNIFHTFLFLLLLRTGKCLLGSSMGKSLSLSTEKLNI